MEEKRLDSEAFARAYGRLAIEDNGDLFCASRVLGRITESSGWPNCGDSRRLFPSGGDVMRA